MDTAVIETAQSVVQQSSAAVGHVITAWPTYRNIKDLVSLPVNEQVCVLSAKRFEIATLQLTVLRQQVNICEAIIAFEQQNSRQQANRCKRLFQRMKAAYRAYHLQHTQYAALTHAYGTLMQHVSYCAITVRRSYLSGTPTAIPSDCIASGEGADIANERRPNAAATTTSSSGAGRVRKSQTGVVYKVEEVEK